MKFTLKDNGILECLSESGSTYEITTSSCSCRGFTFHRICKHYKEAMDQGWIDKLQKIMEIGHNQDYDLRSNPKFISTRIAALKYFFKKKGLDISDDLIRRIEPKVTTKTTPQEVIDWSKI